MRVYCKLTLNIFILSAFVSINNLPGVLSYSDCASSSSFKIKSDYGYVQHYGFYGNLDLLQLSTSRSTYFCFTKNQALKEVKSGKCVGTSYGQLVLTNNCILQWVYNSNTRYLMADDNFGRCISAWNYNTGPDQVTSVPGLSICSGYNHVDLINMNPSKFLVSCYSFII